MPSLQGSEALANDTRSPWHLPQWAEWVLVLFAVVGIPCGALLGLGWLMAFGLLAGSAVLVLGVWQYDPWAVGAVVAAGLFAGLISYVSEGTPWVTTVVTMGPPAVALAEALCRGTRPPQPHINRSLLVSLYVVIAIGYGFLTVWLSTWKPGILKYDLLITSVAYGLVAGVFTFVTSTALQGLEQDSMESPIGAPNAANQRG